MADTPTLPPHAWSAVDLAAAIAARQISAREAVQGALDRIGSVNPRVNAVVELHEAAALAAADEVDRRLAAGDPVGPLAGIPITTKSNTDLRGRPTTNGVPANGGLIAPSDNPALLNLREAGAIVIGRTNVPAYSWRWFTDNELHGPTLNPWSQGHTPGGSSGGAAVAICLGMGALAHGTDYAGSIRLPAANTGIVGLRPTVGRVPGHNETAREERPMSVQLMSVQGPLARTVADARLGLAVMSRGSPRDPWWVPAPLVGPRPPALKVGLCTSLPGFPVDPRIVGLVETAAHALCAAGYIVEPVTLPAFAELYELWLTIYGSEGRLFMRDALDRFGGRDVARAASLVFAMSPDTGADDLVRAYANRTKFARMWSLMLEDWPIILCPNSGSLPMEVGTDLIGAEASERMLRALAWQIVPPLVGVPAVSVPTGIVEKLPSGAQIISGRFREDLCLDAAAIVEAACQFGRRHPMLFEY